MTIPSFLSPPSHQIEVGGKVLKFTAVGPEVMARLVEIEAESGGALRASAGAAFSGAVGPLLSEITKRPELAGRLILDALREEDWVARPVTEEAARQFVDAIDGPTLLVMLAAVVAVNARSFRPLLAGLPAMAEAISGSPATSKTAG